MELWDLQVSREEGGRCSTQVQLQEVRTAPAASILQERLLKESTSQNNSKQSKQRQHKQ